MRGAVKVHCLIVCAVVAPIAIESKRGETGRLDFLQEVLPNFRHRNTPVVDFSGKDKESFAIDLEAVVIPLHNVI